MIRENNDPNRQILPYWPGRGHARGTLHITATSYASSNLLPDPHDADYTCEVRYQIPAVAGAPSARPPASLVNASATSSSPSRRWSGSVCARSPGGDHAKPA